MCPVGFCLRVGVPHVQARLAEKNGGACHRARCWKITQASGGSRPSDKVGGGGGGDHPDPEKRGGPVSKKIFFGSLGLSLV